MRVELYIYKQHTSLYFFWPLCLLVIYSDNTKPSLFTLFLLHFGLLLPQFLNLHGFAREALFYKFPYSWCSHWWSSVKYHGHGYSLLWPMQRWPKVPLWLSHFWWDPHATNYYILHLFCIAFVFGGFWRHSSIYTLFGSTKSPILGGIWAFEGTACLYLMPFSDWGLDICYKPFSLQLFKISHWEIFHDLLEATQIE